MMTERNDGSREAKINPFYDPYVLEYLGVGSVDKVILNHQGEGVTFAELHRQLDERGIVKLRGPNLGMKHIFQILWEVANSQLPVERSYKSMPLSAKARISFVSLHRVWQNLSFSTTPDDEVRRFGSMLVVRPEGNEDHLLVANDISAPSDKYGKKFGALTFPMGYAPRHNPRDGALRILQHEVFSSLALQGVLSDKSNLTSTLLPPDRYPFMRLNIADVRVGVTSVTLPKELEDLGGFDSPKLTGYKWMRLEDIVACDNDDPTFRSGVVDAAKVYENILNLSTRSLPTNEDSTLNRRLSQLFSLPQFKLSVWAARA